MNKKCSFCGESFEILEEDVRFYERLGVPLPTLCPNDRLRRRLSWRNERSLYQGKCDLCRENMITLYAPDSPYKVYCQKCWWADKWDAHEFGREFDFSRGFFEQFADLLREVPMYGLVNMYNSLQNSDYVNYVTDARNCYLTFAANYLEDVMYCSYIWESKDCLDCCYSTGLQLCDDCIDCDDLYNCRSLQNCKNCIDCVFGIGLSGCRNCFACCNLVNKEYYFYNEKLSKEDYLKRVSEVLDNFELFEKERRKFEEFSLKFPRKYAQLINCENSSGNGLKNCKNSFECFEGYGGEDVKWIINFPGGLKDSYDISGCKDVEFSVDCSVAFGYNLKYSHSILNNASNITLCAYLDGGHDLFGCIGLQKGSFCILNKQYSKSEYEELMPKIIEHMKKRGEWGEFFPMTLSPFAYNESVANEYFPLSKEEVLARGLVWRDANKKEYVKSEVSVPKNISEVSDGFVNELLACTRCGRNYRINSQELAFYKKHKIAVPEVCHNCRHDKRLLRRSGRSLWDRNCDKCGMNLRSVFAPEKLEMVYCEKCYLEEVY